LQTRDFVHVSDVAEAIWLALHKPDVGGVFNVSSGKPVGIKQLAEMMSELAGAEYSALVFERSREGDIRCSQGDFSKAEAVLGYKPRIELRDGLGMLLEDFAERIVVDGVAVS
jgi:nucleoside-diphosphate-sugar epimerase